MLSYFYFPRKLSEVSLLVALALIGVVSLFISTRYSMVGINSAPILIEMWYECAVALVPIIALLAAVWLAFLIVYAPVACAASVKQSNTSRKKTFAEAVIASWRYFLLFRNTYYLLVPSLTERLRTLTHRRIPSHLALGWHAGIHPHLA